MTNEIVGTLLGVLIGGFVTWLNTLHQEKRNWNLKKELFSKAIRDDLEHSLLLYDGIENLWRLKKHVHFEYTAELKEYRQVYERNSDLTLQFSKELREKIVSYYSKTKWIITLIETNQRRRIDLITMYQATIKNIKANQPSLKDKDAETLALSLMSSEDYEVNYLANDISDNILKLMTYKNEAQAIINQLKKEN